jgi:hypothetical protein
VGIVPNQVFMSTLLEQRFKRFLLIVAPQMFLGCADWWSIGHIDSNDEFERKLAFEDLATGRVIYCF